MKDTNAPDNKVKIDTLEDDLKAAFKEDRIDDAKKYVAELKRSWSWKSCSGKNFW